LLPNPLWDFGVWSEAFGFNSYHPGGGNMAMCDGSVLFVLDNMDLTAYRNLATISAGEIAGVNQ